MSRRRPVRRQPGVEYGLILLVSQILNFGITYIPPGTLTGIAIQSLLYMGFIKVPWNAEDVCISSLKVFKGRDWRSFVFSNFEHASDMHLYYNMVSFLLKGCLLENMYGTTNFLLLVGLLSLGCSSMYITLGYVLTQITEDYSYYTSCAMGLSAVLFALKMTVVCEESDGPADVFGFRVPNKYAAWAELILIHLLVPKSSFVGHLGGILVGCIYCYTFIGEIIDSFLSKISGYPLVHEEKFYRLRKSWRIFS